MIARPRLVAFVGSLLLTSPAVAAEQGGLGATSKGEIAITVSVASRVALTDASAPAAAGGDAHSACLWLDTATRGYAVSALDAPVVWKSSATAAAGRTVAPGTTLADQSSTAARPDCGHDPALLVGYDIATPRSATLLIAPE